MKKTYRYMQQILSVFLAAILLSSCSDFLEEEPISQQSDGTFWNNETDANSAISGCYAELRKALNNGLAYYAYGDLPTDVFSSDRELRSDWNDVQKVNWGISIGATSDWHPMYKLRDFSLFYATIRQADLCLAKIPTIPESEYDNYDRFDQFMGEAYFIRAFAYFYMARVWGDVPIVDDSKVDELDLTNYQRDDQAKVLAKAIDDCKTALSYLSWDYTDDNERVVRANAGAAWALLAHIYAWQGNYEACENAAAKVMDKGFYSYINRNNYLAIFDGQSDESIFEIAQSEQTEGQGAFNASLALYLLRGEYLTTRETEKETIWQFDLKTLQETLFNDPNDLRRQNGFDDFSDSWPILLKYTKIAYTSETSPISLNNIVVFRLAGIALLKAEAQAAQGKYTDARTTLDDIRDLAGLEASTASDADLYEAIIDERGRELFMEGHRFYDLVRLAREKQVYKFGSSESDKIKASEFLAGKYYWPIQPSILETNPLLVQTKYWQAEMQ